MLKKLLKNIKDRIKKYEDNPELIDEILNEGTEKARKKAIEQMEKIKHAMKIDY